MNDDLLKMIHAHVRDHVLCMQQAIRILNDEIINWTGGGGSINVDRFIKSMQLRNSKCTMEMFVSFVDGGKF